MSSPHDYSLEQLKQAAQVLGLSVSLDFSETEVQARWRKTIERVHPDSGGNAYLAGQANLARDLLLTWIKDRRHASGGASEINYASEDGVSKSDQDRPSAKNKSYRGGSKVTLLSALKWGGAVLYGVLMWFVVIAAILDNGANGSDHLWSLGSDAASDGSVIHYLRATVVGTMESGVSWYIGCNTNGGTSAEDFRSFLIADPGIDIIGFEFRKRDQSSMNTAQVFGDKDQSGKSASLGSLPTIDRMSSEQLMNKFGGSALGLIGKYLTKRSLDELPDDVNNAFKLYYGVFFSAEDFLYDLRYKDNNGVHRATGQIDSATIVRNRNALFKSCYVNNPYESAAE